MLKLNKVNAMAVITAGILLCGAGYSDTSNKFKQMGKDSASELLSGMKSGGDSAEVNRGSDDLLGSLSALQGEDEGSKDQAKKLTQEEKKTADQIKAGKEQVKNVNSLGDKIGKLIGLKEKNEQKKDEAVGAQFQKLASQAPSAAGNQNGSLNNVSKGCSDGINIQSAIDENNSFASGALSKAIKTLGQLANPKNKKKEKNAQAVNEAINADLAAVQKDLLGEEEAKKAEKKFKPLAANATDEERKQHLKDMEPELKKSSKNLEKAWFNVLSTWAPKLAQRSSDKGFKQEITDGLLQDMNVGIDRAKDAAMQQAQAEYDACTKKVTDAGSREYDDNAKGNNNSQGGMNPMMMQAMGGMGAGMMGMNPQIGSYLATMSSTFSQGSAAQQAIQMLQANYGQTPGGLPIVWYYNSLFGNMVNGLQCNDISGQIASQYDNLKKEAGNLGNANNFQTMVQAMEGLKNAFGNTGKKVIQALRPENKQGPIAQCEDAEQVRKSIAQFSQQQGQQQMMQQQMQQQQQGRGRSNPQQQQAMQMALSQSMNSSTH